MNTSYIDKDTSPAFGGLFLKFFSGGLQDVPHDLVGAVDLIADLALRKTSFIREHDGHFPMVEARCPPSDDQVFRYQTDGRHGHFEWK